MTANDRIEIAGERADSADALWCMKQYYAELAARFTIPFDVMDPDLWKVADMIAPNGHFLVARLDGAPAGCGGLRIEAEGWGEVKRVWVSDRVRGMGVATRMMDDLERFARESGCPFLRLDTNGVLDEARAMYARRGYREIPRYNDNPYAQHWFEKALAPQPC